MTVMAEVTARIAQRAARDFGTSAHRIMGRLRALSLAGNVDYERVMAAILIRAAGDWRQLDQAADLAQLDWRDVLMGTGLEHEGWEQLLDADFGPANP